MYTEKLILDVEDIQGFTKKLKRLQKEKPS